MIRKISAITMLMALTLTIGGCGGGGGSAANADSPTPGYNGPVPGPGDPGDGGSAGQPGMAAFAWDAPVTNEDGTALTDLAGYKLYYGTEPGSYTSSINVGTATYYALTGLAPGTYYAVITAYNAGGAESRHSNEVVKSVF